MEVQNQLLIILIQFFFIIQFFNSITESGHSGSPILKDSKVVGIVWGAHAEKGIGYAHLFNEVSLDFINKNIK